MKDETISPLRRRMIEDMTVRNFSADTQRNYIRGVKNLAIFLGRSPDTATPEELRRFQLHLSENRVRPPTINATVTALRFFFNVTVDRPDVTRPLTFVAEPRKIPVVLNPEEVVRFLEAAPGPKYKAAFGAAYGAGLRVSEVAALKVSDIDSQRMMLRVEQGKGPVWKKIAARHGLVQPDLAKLVGWPFGDFIFHTESDVISDVNKGYRFGFTERMDSTTSLITAIDSLKRQKVLP